MNEHDIAEQAYKNGYEAGKRDAVKQGRWIADGWFTKRCSVCHSTPLRENGGQHEPCYSNYCPHCGARMDGEDDG